VDQNSHAVGAVRAPLVGTATAIDIGGPGAWARLLGIGLLIRTLAPSGDPHR
jgi:Na+/alanine symporter